MKPTATPKVTTRKPTARARSTNRPTTWPVADGRALVARRFGDICGQIIADQGGAERVAEVRTQLVRRFAALATMAELAETKLANGEQIDIAVHSTLVSALVRLAGRIGVNRRAREITPTLASYLAGQEAETEIDDDEQDIE